MENPRYSTTSSGVGDTEEQQLNQLVIAQVHHDPILELRTLKEDKESEETKEDEVDHDNKVPQHQQTEPNDEQEKKSESLSGMSPESYSIAGTLQKSIK